MRARKWSTQGPKYQLLYMIPCPSYGCTFSRTALFEFTVSWYMVRGRDGWTYFDPSHNIRWTAPVVAVQYYHIHSYHSHATGWWRVFKFWLDHDRIMREGTWEMALTVPHYDQDVDSRDIHDLLKMCFCELVSIGDSVGRWFGVKINDRKSMTGLSSVPESPVLPGPILIPLAGCRLLVTRLAGDW